MNIRGILAIYKFEMGRTLRTLGQSIASPVLSTMLYFIVFGSAIGSRIQAINDIPYGAFIVPGLIMLTVLGQVCLTHHLVFISRALLEQFMKFSAPLSFIEIVLGYVGAAATKSVLVGVIVLITAWFFVPLHITHPLWMGFFLIMTSVTFSLLGFIIGIWADGFEKLQLIPLLVITPLTFLGGSFYSINMLPHFWYQVSLANPVVYLVSGFRWSFYEHGDVSLITSVTMILTFTVVCLVIIGWIFKTGYGLKK